MADPSPDRPAREQPPAGFLAVTCTAGLAAAVLFIAFPGIDLAVSGLFHRADSGFLFRTGGIGPALRDSFGLLFLAGCVAVALGLLVSGLARRRLLGLGFVHWLYLALCLALGPGLVANVVLKDNWGRARPAHVLQFGGDLIFTPALAISDQCVRNCSFVAGEASSIYMLFFALALAVSVWRRQLMAAALVLGTAAGVVRIGAGGHFLSDVVFAGIFMALVAWALHWAILERDWAALVGGRWRGAGARPADGSGGDTLARAARRGEGEAP